MEQGPLEELAQSIRVNGIIQPILVRRSGDRYEIVAGERRWRAAQIAGLLRVPVVVREIADDPAAAGRADREHPAREPQPDRRGLGLPPPARRMRDDPGGARRGRRQGSRLDRQPPAPAPPAGRGPAPGVRRCAVDGPRPGPRRAREPADPEEGGRRRGRPRPVGPRDRGAGPPPERAAAAARVVAGQGRAHARSRRRAEAGARHPRPHRPQGQGRQGRDRLRLGRRAQPNLRAHHRQAAYGRPAGCADRCLACALAPALPTAETWYKRPFV